MQHRRLVCHLQLQPLVSTSILTSQRVQVACQAVALHIPASCGLVLTAAEADLRRICPGAALADLPAAVEQTPEQLSAELPACHTRRFGVEVTAALKLVPGMRSAAAFDVESATRALEEVTQPDSPDDLAIEVRTHMCTACIAQFDPSHQADQLCVCHRIGS